MNTFAINQKQSDAGSRALAFCHKRYGKVLRQHSWPLKVHVHTLAVKKATILAGQIPHRLFKKQRLSLSYGSRAVMMDPGQDHRKRVQPVYIK